MGFATNSREGRDCVLSAKKLPNLEFAADRRTGEGFVGCVAEVWKLRQIVAEVTAASWVTKLAQSLGFDLPNALPRNLEILTDFF